MAWKLGGTYFENCSCDNTGRSGFSAPFSWAG